MKVNSFARKVFLVISMVICIGVPLSLLMTKISDVYVLSDSSDKTLNIFLEANVQSSLAESWSVNDSQKKVIVKKVDNFLRFKVPPFQRYKIQLLKYNKYGNKNVYMNGVCNFYHRYEDPTSSWKKELYIVNDGGRCFFGGVYNIDTKEIIEFSFNSSATE